MTDFTIELDVPISEDVRAWQRGWAHALARAPIGASVLVTGTPHGRFAYGNGWTTTRRVEGGTRVWKIAEPTSLKANRFGRAVSA